MRKGHALAALVAAASLLGLMAWIGADAARQGAVAQGPQARVQSHTEWVAASLREMASVRPGMTRGDLLRVFTTEGGLFTQYQRTYAYRGCPYFKVDVRFKHRSDRRPARVDPDNPRDVIETISRPYLGSPIFD